MPRRRIYDQAPEPDKVLTRYNLQPICPEQNHVPTHQFFRKAAPVWELDDSFWRHTSIPEETPGMTRVQLAKFRSEHVPLLRRWLSADHVCEWFPEPDEMIEWAENVPVEGRQFIAEADEQPVGYVRWTYVAREALDEIGFGDLPDRSADIDLLIGTAEYTGRGIGSAILDEALARIRREGITELAALTTSIRNTRAQRAFERAGFVFDRQYEPDGFGLCNLMLRSV